MSRRKSGVERTARKNRRRCPKCRSVHHSAKDYDDAVLYICTDCQYPERVVKP